MLIMGGCARVGQGGYGKSLDPPFNFAVNLKLLLKKKKKAYLKRKKKY